MKKLLIILTLLCCNSAFSTTITIGTASTSNTDTVYPTAYGGHHWGAKQQYLIKASELSAAGMAIGNINSITFNVSGLYPVPLQNYTIAIKNTSLTTINTWVTGLTTVFPAQIYTATLGLNTHAFISPYYWNGIDNLVIEICYQNNIAYFNSNTNYTTTPFNSAIYYAQFAAGICSTTAMPNTSSNRPNMNFDWTASSLPPAANFVGSPTSSCNGIVTFIDSTLNYPTSWLWIFGDGTISNLQNPPTHIYNANGTYDVELITCNIFGCDTLLRTNYITVNSTPSLPVTVCIPSTLNYCCDFGITNVAFNTLNKASNGGVDGYSDFTCTQTTVLEGQVYTLSIQTNAPSTQNYAAWIDFNNDGLLDDVTERVFTSSSQLNTAGVISIPSGTTLNTPLRMRVSADFDFSTAPTPCTNLDRGQAEDYTVVITANTNPPATIFMGNPVITCSGSVCFTDQSLNFPTGWSWDFGDGGTSNLPNPCHTYLTDGTYTVSLITTNAYGSDTLISPNYITVNTAAQLSPALCTPITNTYCCSNGIYQVDFNNISNTTADGIDGYQDYSCENFTMLTEGLSYTLAVETGLGNPQDTRAWIDFNNDGIFNNANELIMDISNAYNPSLSILTPTNAVINTSLRMRISSDITGTPQSACDANAFGQTEDYRIIIQPNTNPPTVNFSGNPTISCSIPICFIDSSISHIPMSWLWDFGDGDTSTVQNPCHTYLAEGDYTVTLIATNAFGSDTATFSNYINIDCSIFNMPITGTDTLNLCSGTLYDDGGPNSNYSNNTNGVIVIQPPNASQINITFTLLSIDFFDTINVYDGSNTSSLLLHSLNHSVIPSTIYSTGGSITIEQLSGNGFTQHGFALTWSCTTVGVDEKKLNASQFLVYPNPTTGILNIETKDLHNNIKELVLFNTLGKAVLQKRVAIKNTPSLQLNVAHLSKGLYFLKILSSDGTVTLKITIQ